MKSQSDGEKTRFQSWNEFKRKVWMWKMCLLMTDVFFWNLLGKANSCPAPVSLYSDWSSGDSRRSSEHWSYQCRSGLPRRGRCRRRGAESAGGTVQTRVHTLQVFIKHKKTKEELGKKNMTLRKYVVAEAHSSVWIQNHRRRSIAHFILSEL